MSIHTSYTDEQLFELIKESNEEAFHEIYHRYWKRMYAMACLRLERTDIAEDIVQDVFTSLWEKRERLSVANPEHWLATAVKYKIINLVNRQLKKEISTGDLPEIPQDDALFDERVLNQLLQTEINRLPEKCRLVFRFSRETDLTNKEIADRLSISEKAVEKHITKARKELSFNLRNIFQSIFSFLF